MSKFQLIQKTKLLFIILLVSFTYSCKFSQVGSETANVTLIFHKENTPENNYTARVGQGLTGTVCLVVPYFGDQCKYIGKPGTDTNGFIYLLVSSVKRDFDMDGAINVNTTFIFKGDDGKMYSGKVWDQIRKDVVYTDSDGKFVRKDDKQVTIKFWPIDDSNGLAVNDSRFGKESETIDFYVNHCETVESSNYQLCGSAKKE